METNYVALHTDREVYGVCAVETLEDNMRVMDWAARNGVHVTTGKLYSPDELLRHAAISLRPGCRP